MTTNGVNKPLDPKRKEVDINTKLQLYGIYSAFAKGKVPSNKQIDVAMNSALESKVFNTKSSKLSDDGQKLVADLKNVIEQAKMLVLTKNEGNLLQDFIWQTQHLTSGDAQKPGAPVDKDAAKQHGNEALEGLRTLGTLIISNGQFRKLLSDALVLARSMVGDAATKTAERVHPGEERLNAIDEPAPDDTWHDVPDLSKDKIRNQMKSAYEKNKPFSKADAEKAAGDAAQASHPDGSRDPAGVADLAARDQQEGTASGVDAQSGAQAGLDNLKGTASQNIPDETKDQANQAKEKGNKLKDSAANYAKEKMPKERREQTIWRLKKMIVEIQGHSDYQQAIDTLLRLAEEYTGHARTVGQQSTGAVKGAHTDNSLQTAEADLKTLIERFANNSSLDDVFDSINQIYRDADQDPELKNFFKEVDSFIRACLKEQGYILQDSSNQRWNELYDRGNYLLREKYRGHTDRVLDEFKFIGNQFDADPQNKAFGEAVNKLFLDLGNDENGKPTFKPHLLKDLSDVILPATFENIRYVPIPRIEVQDKMIDAVVENIVIEGDNLAPNVMEFSTDNYWRWGRKSISNKNKNKIMLSVSGIQADLKDVSYHIKKKEGFPSITDTGLMDVYLGGSGFGFKIAFETPDKSDGAHFFKITSVHVDVKNLKIKMKKSNHKLLFNIAKPILLKVMRPVMQKVLEKQIRETASELDAKLFLVHQEAKKAEAEAKRNPDPEHLENMYQRYATAAQKIFMQGKQKAEAAQDRAAGTQTNVAMTQHDSIFPNIKLPGGISTKATEYKDLASKGEKWESPVFSIGSAKESSNIPKAGGIKRRNGAAGSANSSPAPAGASAGNTNGGAGNLSSQMNQAFDGNNDLSLNGKAPNGTTNGAANGHTTLGTSNPVLTGSA
ncbi:hypothetical protein K402DRAFT_451620 [Aulographum hederae CBS 113979]|uniref:Bactericidal permeability-increasing protein n=1 Tax=Aulographum hederae CBS 113979 TaxID=1176131 RepID=A0A6G1H9W4_9PEZI|nr:hypothetical protein K402DRAFT_451620 [Aulographum hederae CBS 113979]